MPWMGNTGALDTDARHQDANGDGMIDRYDSTVISDNFGKTKWMIRIGVDIRLRARDHDDPNDQCPDLAR